MKETHTIQLTLGEENMGFSTLTEAETAFNMLCDRIYQIAKQHQDGENVDMSLVVGQLLREGLHPGLIGAMVRASAKDMLENGTIRALKATLGVGV